MKKYFIAIIVVVAFVASTMPVHADTAFNDMSKCIKTWGKGCCGECGGTKAPAATTGKKGCACMTDALGNKVPCQTNNSGKTSLGH